MNARWRTLPGERMELYSPIGLKPLDVLTGLAPVGWVRPRLEASDGAGGWLVTDVRATFSLGGVITYPGLERRGNASGLPARRYRVRIEAQFYAPLYRSATDGIEFDAFPYNDLTPPQNYDQIKLSQPQPLELMPLPGYPFPLHVPLLRGRVEGAGEPVADALVNLTNLETALTDSRGTFALPLRSIAPNTPLNIDAADLRTGRTGTIPIQFPDDLTTSHTIPIA